MADRDSLEATSRDLYNEVVVNTGGWASTAKMHILNTALRCMEADEQYLEIGSYVGRSLVGALLDNDKSAQVIDPFELFLPDGNTIHKAWTKAITDFGVADRVNLHKTLCADFNSGLPPIGVYYYDGDHDSGHTYEGLKKFEQYLTDSALIIVDDYLIFGGNAQTPYPGHSVDVETPVKTDTDRWVAETKEAELVCILPWEDQSAVIRYERNR